MCVYVYPIVIVIRLSDFLSLSLVVNVAERHFTCNTLTNFAVLCRRCGAIFPRIHDWGQSHNVLDHQLNIKSGELHMQM